jgi:hypothetical protein
MSQTGTASAPPASSSVADVLNNILYGLESGLVSIVVGAVAIFMPQLVGLSEQALLAIGNNFRAFLAAVDRGTPWGEALADMMTADWNEVEGDAKQAAIDFAEAVAIALEKAGLIPGK